MFFSKKKGLLLFAFSEHHYVLRCRADICPSVVYELPSFFFVSSYGVVVVLAFFVKLDYVRIDHCGVDVSVSEFLLYEG